MAWHKLFAVGVVATFAAAACTVTSGDGDDDGDGGAAGADTGGSGGASGGSGGASGGTGGASGGAGGAACEPVDTTDDCQVCVQTNCFDLWCDCTTDECAGTDTTEGEVQCVIDCMDTRQADAGSVDENDFASCGAQCAQGEFGQLTDEADWLVTCMRQGEADAGANCAEACFNLF